MPVSNIKSVLTNAPPRTEVTQPPWTEPLEGSDGMPRADPLAGPSLFDLPLSGRPGGVRGSGREGKTKNRKRRGPSPRTLTDLVQEGCNGCNSHSLAHTHMPRGPHSHTHASTSMLSISVIVSVSTAWVSTPSLETRGQNFFACGALTSAYAARNGGVYGVTDRNFIFCGGGPAPPRGRVGAHSTGDQKVTALLPWSHHLVS